jgi:hypothetical protein
MVLWQELRKNYGKVMRRVELKTGGFASVSQKIRKWIPENDNPRHRDLFRLRLEARDRIERQIEKPFSVIFP